MKGVKITFIINLLTPAITLNSFFNSKMNNSIAYTTNIHTYTMANPLMPCSRYNIYSLYQAGSNNLNMPSIQHYNTHTYSNTAQLIVQ